MRLFHFAPREGSKLPTNILLIIATQQQTTRQSSLTLAVDPTSGAPSRLAASPASRAGSRRDSRTDNSTGWKLPPLASPSAVVVEADLDFVPNGRWITRHFTRWPSTNLQRVRVGRGHQKSMHVNISSDFWISLSLHRTLKGGLIVQ